MLASHMCAERRSAARWAVAVGVAWVGFSASACTRGDKPQDRGAQTAASASAAPASEPLRPRAHAIPRPPRAVVELALLVDRPEEAVEPLLAPAALARLVEPRHCGDAAACDAVRGFIADPARFSASLEQASDWPLPE